MSASTPEEPARSKRARSDGVVPSPPASPFVGRDGELADLVAALDEAAAHATIAVIEGEPGIGKTRLADQLRLVAAERGALTVWGRSDEGGAAPALWPWLAPLRAVAEHLGEPPLPLAGVAGETEPLLTGQADALRYEWFESVVASLERASSSAPVVVLLDDLQWADQTSLELLGFLAQRLDRGVLVVGTMRQLEVGRNDALTEALAVVARRAGSRRIRLRGLPEDATSALLGAVGRRAVAPDVAAAVHARAEGNPFYAIELARLIDEEGVGQVPGTVGDVIRRRIGRLPEPTQETLSVAAVVGRDVPPERVAAVSGVGLEEVLDLLEPAVVHRLLVESPEQPGALRFSHALVREVLLDDLTPLRRARLHLRVADAIEAGGAGVDDAEILAEHLWRAAPVGVGRRAADALEAAADVAIRRLSYASAEDLLSKAIRLRRASGSSAQDDEAELMAIYRWLEVARARRYFQGVHQPELLARARELAERLGSKEVLLDIVWFEWSALATSSRVAEAAALGVAHWELTAHDPEPRVRARAYQVAGVLQWMQGDLATAASSLDRALELLDGVPPPTSGLPAELLMVANTFSFWMHAACGHIPPEEAFARADALLAATGGDRFALASICGFAATTAVALGRWEDTERFAATGLAADPDSQFAFWAGQVLMQRGIVQAWKGDLDAAVETFRAGLDRYTGVGGRSGTPTFEASMALHLARHGRLELARVHVTSARRRLEAHGERWNESLVLISEGVLAGLEGDTAQARRLVGQAVAVATAQGADALAARARTEAALHGWEPAEG
jgi:tetratricopeptide (TPR) repeat protein